MAPQQPADFAKIIDREAEIELKKAANQCDPKPQILKMEGFTSQDASSADPSKYRIVDLVKTLIYLEAGTKGVNQVFDKDALAEVEISSFNEHTSSGFGVPSIRHGWKVTAACRLTGPSHVSRTMRTIKISYWTQVRMKKEIDLDNDTETWLFEDDRTRPTVQIELSLGAHAICKPINCSLQPSILSCTQGKQIDIVSYAMNMMLLHEIAAIRENQRFTEQSAELSARMAQEQQEMEESARPAKRQRLNRDSRNYGARNLAELRYQRKHSRSGRDAVLDRRIHRWSDGVA